MVLCGYLMIPRICVIPHENKMALARFYYSNTVFKILGGITYLVVLY